ncbi:PASTA domain-containing protein [Evansella halocellulosilytica]|uniref:PASTA domain-containing protein n=1 Tax=Evansella halocellulosilytica TaxID=2011013 RepID=UPI000BB82A2B|nr:PASTA domain-containing protein [Evansella halocellulosilytica]
MSDFLSKFNKDKYDKLLDEQEQKDSSEPDQSNEKQEAEEELEHDETDILTPKHESKPSSRRNDAVEELEYDPSYHKKKRKVMIGSIAGALVAVILIFIIYYQVVHVKMEDFVGEAVSDARAWASEHNIEMELTHEHTMEYDSNQIMSQSVPAGENVRKGGTITFVSSTGPDPDEVISLPDFEEMSQHEAATWIADYKAENLQLVPEYSDDIDEGEFIRFEIRDSSIDESEYRRRDNAIVYYSRGEEVFEKDIEVPDFTGQPKSEVEQWAESNEIEISYEEEDSNNIEADMIISQSVSPEEKVAKRDTMEVTVSLGEAVVVPNFGELTIEEATSYPGLSVMVQQRYHADVSYGGLISQSVEEGTKLTERDDKELTVVYSNGRPFLNDYRGQLEGELPRLFYEEYQSKGANIQYTVKYVDAPEVKGTVVEMSNFNEFVPMSYTVEIKVSNNSSGDLVSPDPGGDWDEGEVEPSLDEETEDTK